MAFIYDLTDTWNAGGTTFSAIKMNVTDTASAAASKLVTLQVGGTEKFSVQKDGFTDVNGNVRLSAASPAIELNLGGPQLYVPAANTFALATGGGIGSPVERLRVDASGNVGIGTSSPSGGNAPLTIQNVGGSGSQINFRNAATTDAFVGLSGDANGDLISYLGSAKNQIFYTNAAERMRITSTGSVGIGTSSPGYRLSVYNNINGTPVSWGNATRTGFLYQDASGVGRTDGANTAFTNGLYMGTAGTFAALYTNSTERMRIDSSGNVGIGTSNPTSIAGYTTLEINNGTNGAILDLAQADTMRGRLVGTAGSFAIETNTGIPITFSPAGVQQMLLSTSGNVGIGTSSPGYNADIAGIVNTSQSFRYGASYFGSASDYFTSRYLTNMVFNVPTSSGFVWAINGGDTMTLNSSGNLGLGTTSPSTILHINAGASFDTNVRLQAGAAGNHAKHTYSNSSNTVAWTSGYQSSTGNFGINAGDSFNATGITVTSAGRMLIGTTTGVGADFTSIRWNSGGSYPQGLNMVDSNASASGTTFQVFRKSDDTYLGNIRRSSTDNALYVGGNSYLALGSGDTERMRIDSSGNLLVGTTTTNGDGISIKPRASAGSTSQVNFNRASSTTTGYPIVFQNGGTDVGFISHNNTTTTYNTSSDARLKHDIVDAPDAADLIDAIQVRSFKWNADNSEQRYGMVAQELVEVAPEAVSGDPEGEEMMGVDYSKLVPMLVKEIQSMRLRLAQLEG